MRGPLGARQRGPHSIPELLFTALAVVVACVRQQQNTLPPTLEPAEAYVRVSSGDLIVAFPKDSEADTPWSGGQVSDRFAGPEWRVMIRVDTAFLAAVHKVYPASDLALPSYGSLREVVRAGQLTNCQLHEWILACGQLLDGSVEVLGGRVLLRIRSPAWLKRLRDGHPEYASLSRYKSDRQLVYGHKVVINYGSQ
jgi:hypothetical protein